MFNCDFGHLNNGLGAKPAETPQQSQRAPTVSDFVNPNPPPPPPPATASVVSSGAAQTIPPSGLLTAGSKGVPVIETVTAYEVRQQKDLEMRDNDVFWASKLKELEARVSFQGMNLLEQICQVSYN